MAINRSVLCIAPLAILLFSAPIAAQEPFFKGKTLTRIPGD